MTFGEQNSLAQSFRLLDQAFDSGINLFDEADDGGRNSSLICSPAKVMTKGIWLGGSPIQASTPLLLFQLSFISSLTFIFNTFFQYLWQSTVVSQIFSGIVIGPSLLGHQAGFLATFFPMKGHLVLETLAKFGLIFFLFSIGLKMDSEMMTKPGKQALTFGLCAFFLTLILTMLMSFLLRQTIAIDDKAFGSGIIYLIASSQGLTGFPVIACLLTELKILNTDMGRLALSTSMICDFVGIAVTAISFSLMLSADNIMLSVNSFLSVVALIGVIVYVFKPIVLHIRSRMILEKGVQETFIILIFLLVLITSFASESIGQHYVFGPLVFGIVVPDGPPLGTALTQKIDTLATGLLYPIFCAMVGLQTNMYTVNFTNFWIVGIVVLFGFFSKIISVMLPGLFFNIPVRDGFILGLILNARGVIELTVYNLWKETQLVNDEMFTLCILYVVLVTAIVTPLIKFLYDPLKQFRSMTRSTIQQQAKQDPELRVLIGILNHESVPSIINLLDVSQADEDSPLTVIAMALIELMGRTTPVLVSHKEQKTQKHSTSIESKIFNALDQFERTHEGELEVKTYTSISYFDMMHEDICRVAADEQANIAIVPFHKQWAIDGSIGFTSRAVQNMNIRVLDTAPCSVGIMVDRGVMSGSTTSNAQPFGHVGVIFIGGPDDAECLAYGARMVRQRNVHVTVVRYLLFGSEKSKERKEETHLVDEYRRMYSGNARFMYVEEVVRDAEGLSSSIRSITDCFGLILVGRSHIGSPLVTGMTDWSECPELGAVGDMLASPDFGSMATVLVIQQQKVSGGKWMTKQRKEDQSHSHGGGKVDDWSIP